MDDKDNQTPSLFRQGLLLMNSNKLQEAKLLFTQICETNPLEVDAWYQLSTINGMMGEISEADRCCRRALDIQPDHCEARINLGNALLSQGKTNDAIAQYQRVLQLNPQHAIAHINLGNLLTTIGKYDEAAANYQAAIQLDPNSYVVFYHLGNLRARQGDYAKAVKNYRRTIQLNPNDTQSRLCLGVALLNMCRNDEALSTFLDILRLQPEHVDAITHMGTIYLNKGELDKAISHYQRALAINPHHAAALDGLAQASLFQGRFDIYIAYYRRAIEHMPDADTARINFIDKIRNIAPSGYDSWLDDELKKCFLLKEANFDSLTLFTIHHLKHKYDIQAHRNFTDKFVQSLIENIASDDLFLLFLKNTLNTDADMEGFLTRVRQTLLLRSSKENGVDFDQLKVVSALAHQGLNNEYIFAYDTEENRQLDNLKELIEQLAPTLSSPNEELEWRLLVFGMYDRIYSLSCRTHLCSMPTSAWSETIRLLTEQTLLMPQEEAKIKEEIVSIGSVDDEISQLVQSQYEKNPYPRWQSIPKISMGDISSWLKQEFPHFSPPTFPEDPIRVLVAGCGTGRQPIQTALYFNNVEVLAIDISKSSLAYAIRMARNYNVKNIQFMQGDILELANLQKRFHVIECSGVLHHLKNPVAGWKVLTNLLVPNGLMSISLYSEKARKDIVAAREIIEQNKIMPTDKEIRDFRAKILNHEAGELLYKCTTRLDFYSTSACRDLLFHFMEHRFTIPEINQTLNDLNLEFIGFEFPSSHKKKQ